MNDTKLQNLLLVALFVIVTLFTAYQEDYLRQFSGLFWLALTFGFAMAFWMACTISTTRLLSLMLGIFLIEYVKETIGTWSGMWVYHGKLNAYNFVIWSWVMVGMTVFWLAVRLVIRGMRKLTAGLPRRWNLINPVIVVLVFAVIPLTLGDYRLGAGRWFWGLYAVLFLVTLVTAIRMEFPVFLGLLLTTWVLGFPSEYLGSVPNRLWTFPHNPDFPPFFLIMGCWPLEIFTQYALSAFLANELLDKYTFREGN